MAESTRTPCARALLFLLVVCGAQCASAADLSVANDSKIAQLGDKAIPYSELRAEVPSKMEAMQRQYDAKLSELTLSFARSRSAYLESEAAKFLDDKVLALEATARKTTPLALMDAVKSAPVSDADMHAFYDSQSVQIGQPFDTVAPQLKRYLQNESAQHARRQYLASLRTKYRAAVTFEPLREHIDPIGPRRGPDNAAVTIIEFSDFECPFCGRFTPVLQRILTAYPTQVRLIFRNYPLRSVHQNAEKAAEAGVCAKAQGKFWEMHDVLFAEQNSLSTGALKEKAKRIGLDSLAFDKCLDSGGGAADVKTDGEAGVKLGLTSTPTSFVNGRYVDAALSFDEMSALIDDELRRVSLAAAH